MNYQEQIKKAVQEFYDVTKAFASSRHYILSYWWVESNFGLDLNDKTTQSDVREMSYSDEFCDLIQTIDFDDKNKEVLIMIWESNEMKKYTLENYKEFCQNALVAPPIEEFEDGSIDEEQWYKDHSIHITVGNHDIEVGYFADNVNEIEFALEEMYEAEYGDGTPTTGNTVGSQYRAAELKDLVRYFILWRYENYGGLNWFDYAKQAIVELSDIQSVIGMYEHADKIAQETDFKCNWHNFRIETLKDVTEEGIKKIILDLVGSNFEVSYDPHTDKSFIIDYTFNESGDFIGWTWGSDNNDIQEVIAQYKIDVLDAME